MALKKQIETESGISIEYHRIVDITLQVSQADVPQIRLLIVTAVYIDHATRVAGKAPVLNRQYGYDVGLIAAGTGVNDLKTAAYTLLKTHSDFVGAEDY